MGAFHFIGGPWNGARKHYSIEVKARGTLTVPDIGYVEHDGFNIPVKLWHDYRVDSVDGGSAFLKYVGENKAFAEPT